MTAHSHQFTEPYTRWSETTDQSVNAIEAQLQRESELREWARKILAEGPEALNICLRSDEAAEWTYRAGQYLALDGQDDGDFDGMLTEYEVEQNPLGYGAADLDFLRDERVGMVSWGMGA